jgi:hypothetical protein
VRQPLSKSRRLPGFGCMSSPYRGMRPALMPDSTSALVCVIALRRISQLGAARADGCLSRGPSLSFLFVSFRSFSFLRLFPLVMLGVALTAHVEGATVHVQSLPAIHSFLSILYTLGRRRPVIAYDLLQITHALFYVFCVSLVLFSPSSDPV